MANLVRRNEGTRAIAARDPLQPVREAMQDWMRWDPFQAMAPLAGRTFADAFEPSFDVRETTNAFIIEADLPGVKPEDVDVTLTGNRLQISGRREAEEETRQGTYYSCERFHGSFTRAFTMPEGIDADNATTDVKHGVLTVTLPKRPEAQPRRITIGPTPKTKA
jgi:HSP20 family protein